MSAPMKSVVDSKELAEITLLPYPEDREKALWVEIGKYQERIAALEAQNRQLRDALLRFVSVATDAMPWSEHLDKAVVQGRAALAATEPKERK